jgi:arsenate reductase-like glutaredoxin family protein
MGVATLYGIRNCDTVKKARAWLEEHRVAYSFHDYKLSGIELERLKRWCTELGWEALLNRSGTLMVAQPSMIKRPVVELVDRLVVGFKPELYESLKW